MEIQFDYQAGTNTTVSRVMQWKKSVTHHCRDVALVLSYGASGLALMHKTGSVSGWETGEGLKQLLLAGLSSLSHISVNYSQTQRLQFLGCLN